MKKLEKLVNDLTESTSKSKVNMLRHEINSFLLKNDVRRWIIREWNQVVNTKIHELECNVEFPTTHADLLEVKYVVR